MEEKTFKVCVSGEDSITANEIGLWLAKGSPFSCNFGVPFSGEKDEKDDNVFVDIVSDALTGKRAWVSVGKAKGDDNSLSIKIDVDTTELERAIELMEKYLRLQEKAKEIQLPRVTASIWDPC